MTDLCDWVIVVAEFERVSIVHCFSMVHGTVKARKKVLPGCNTNNDRRQKFSPYVRK